MKNNKNIIYIGREKKATFQKVLKKVEILVQMVQSGTKLSKNIQKVLKKVEILVQMVQSGTKSPLGGEKWVRFFEIRVGEKSKGKFVVYPHFKYGIFEDLMVRGGKPYAVFDEVTNLWSTDLYDIIRIVDSEVYKKTDQLRSEGNDAIARTMTDADTKLWERFLIVANKLPDNFEVLDRTVTFSNIKPRRSDYISKQLPYFPEEKETPAYEKLMSTLYDYTEREKIEWFVGSILAGESKDVQKFLVIFGDPGSGKSTVINMIIDLFPGYSKPFNAEALGSRSKAFAMETFASNPIVAYDQDADLSRVETNTRLNSIISHDMMEINEKYKSAYSIKLDSVLLVGTNSPVKITDAKSGVIRRLLDCRPSGRRLPFDVYQQVVAQLSFERSGIAHHCLQVYKERGRSYYDAYKPLDMIERTDIFFNFVDENYDVFAKEDGVGLKRAYDMYKNYISESNFEFGYSKTKFRDELRNYFREFHKQIRIGEENRKNYYKGFRKEKFHVIEVGGEEKQSWIVLNDIESEVDKVFSDCLAQYATDDEKPRSKWGNVTTKLSDLDTHRLHYILPPPSHIVIDFDLRDEMGNKSLDLNLEAASKFPPTYCEISKGGSGLHLHYIYNGDTTSLAALYSDGIEVKVFHGYASLRRRLSKCNNLPISTISEGLPLKGKKMIDNDRVMNERGIRALVEKNLRKEIMGATKPSVDFIKKILDDAYISGIPYDIRDMRPAVLSFANNSSNQSQHCIRQVAKMHFFSEQEPENSSEGSEEVPIVFYDVEVFPNLFLINWKYRGKNKRCVRMINPKPEEVEELFKFRLIGFNNRRYDNHIIYAAYLGYSNIELYNLSQRLINDSLNSTFSEAYNLSYTDVYDFASAQHKQSLKKFEIELGIHHKELGLPWDKPVPEERWLEVAEYCDNDVIATEATFDYLAGDWAARQILAKLSGLTVNDTTNQHTVRIVFGKDKRPQDRLVYVDLSKEFPGYTFDHGKSYYRGEETGEGGYVYAEPGIYYNVALLDIASMHPTSFEQLGYLGPYAQRYSDLKKARLAIKHEDWAAFDTLLDGELKGIIAELRSSERLSLKDLSNALKTALNSAYGLSSAKFDNAFRHKDNIDNIVAKRGALFMVDLKNAVQELGYTVAHIKTDSIKIPEADDKIIQFVMDFGKKYGYEFEHEATYEKMCLVNNAVYIAKYKDKDEWTATGAEFAHSYIFKTLFSGEPIEFKDLCETKSVKSAMYLDFNENLEKGEHDYHFVGRVGSFCPVIDGVNGGVLVRDQNGKMNAVTGSAGYRWMESEMVKALGYEDKIDRLYFNTLSENAYKHIREFGDADLFIFGKSMVDFKNAPQELRYHIVARIKEEDLLPF